MTLSHFLAAYSARS